MVYTAPWHKITDTTVDISVKTWLKKSMIAEIAKSPNPAAQYLAKYADEEFRWDELAAAAWLDPSIITKETQLTWTWTIRTAPATATRWSGLPARSPASASSSSTSRRN